MRARLPRRIEQRLRMSEHVHQKPSNGKIFVKHAFRAWSGMKSESMEDSGLSARLSTSVPADHVYDDDLCVFNVPSGV